MRLCTVKGEDYFMNRDDVREVLITAIKLIGLKTKEELSISDIRHLANQVWQNEEFQGYVDMTLSRDKEVYCISRSELDRIFTEGLLEFINENNKKIRLVLRSQEVETMILENGGVLMWYEGDKK